MASCNFSLCSLKASISSKPYKSPKSFKIQSHSQFRVVLCNDNKHKNNNNYCFHVLNLYPTCSRSVKSFLSVDRDSAVVETSEEDEALPSVIEEEEESDTNEKTSSSLKSLLQEYKEAILNTDEKTASDIEGSILQVVTEKDEQLAKVASLSSDITAGRERYLRLQADFDNFRKRSEKERLTIRSDAQGEVIESLLPMVDNFERAKQQLKVETEKEKQIDASYQGIYKQFVEIMRSLNVASVPTVGKPFDPSFHEAIAREESQEFKDGIITQEFRRGFVLGERLLRPAMVKVSAGPGAPHPSTEPEPELEPEPEPSTTVDQPQAAAEIEE